MFVRSPDLHTRKRVGTTTPTRRSGIAIRMRRNRSGPLPVSGTISGSLASSDWSRRGLADRPRAKTNGRDLPIRNAYGTSDAPLSKRHRNRWKRGCRREGPAREGRAVLFEYRLQPDTPCSEPPDGDTPSKQRRATHSALEHRLFGRLFRMASAGAVLAMPQREHEEGPEFLVVVGATMQMFVVQAGDFGAVEHVECGGPIVE